MVMALRDLVAPWPDLDVLTGADTPVTSVQEDSRRVEPGAVFVAVDGSGADGHRFVDQAVAAGASALVVDRARLDELRAALHHNRPVAWVAASCTRGLPARLAREIEGRPDEHLTMAGITGTNGKTTSAFLMQSLLTGLGRRSGLLGTIRYDDGDKREPAPLTTPGGPALYRWLGRMVAAGCGAAAMELSSHALEQQRAGDLALDVAVMTNLGRDHLDYHGDMASYLAAKALIIDLLRDRPGRGKPAGIAVINAGDPAIAGVDTTGVEAVRFAVSGAPGPVDLQVTAAQLDLTGTRLRLDWRGRRLDLQSPLVGRFNVENLAGALAAGLALGFAPDACMEALARLDQVPGRMERFVLPNGALAVVDYAHTHDALAAVLHAADEIRRGRLVAVFGCGGDRDRGKRPLMGEVAATASDVAWITSDNPRSEPPAAICDEIVTGFDAAATRRAAVRHVVVDRREAIESALDDARDGDVVVVAGKGHEDYQIVGADVRHFDDREVIRQWIGARNAHD
jgi:UDP-N-acetylmuramoyl-L-alanyl-D-glutamate--2,6-diaminopimelate ligase